MDTKLRGDIAEQAAVLQAMKRGWGVLRPVGDRLPYNLVFDIALAYIEDVGVCYLFPCAVFVDYGSEIHMVEADKRQ